MDKDNSSSDFETVNGLIPGIAFAGQRSIFLLHHMLEKFAEHDPRTFLAMLKHALDDEATRRNLATMVRSGHRDREIQALIDYDLRSEKFRAGAETVESEEFDGSSHNLTVAAARRRVMADTGQSERAVIRQTKGWSADEVIRLIA